MKKLVLGAIAAGLVSLIGADYAFAKGWCGGKAKGAGRTAAGQARTRTDFSAPTFPGTKETAGQSGNYFESIREVDQAKKKGYLTVLYLYNSEDGAARIKKFEDVLFKNEKVALAFKVFRQLKLDVSKDAVAKDVYGKSLPRFVAFNTKGQIAAEVTLKGYKSSSNKVLKVLTKAAKGHGKMPLMTFVKKYRTFLNDLDKLEKRKEVLAGKKTRAGSKKAKLKKIAKEEAAIAKIEKKLMKSEQSLLAAVKAFSKKSGGVVVAAK